MKSLKYAVLALVAIGCAAQDVQKVPDYTATRGVSSMAVLYAVLTQPGFEECSSLGWPNSDACNTIARASMSVLSMRRAKFGLKFTTNDDQGFTGPLTIANHGNHCTTPTKEHPTCVR